MSDGIDTKQGAKKLFQVVDVWGGKESVERREIKVDGGLGEVDEEGEEEKDGGEIGNQGWLD